MFNRDTQAAWDYHNNTKHTWRSVHSGGHSLDWNNQPRPFKLYPGLEGQPLPRDIASSGVPALDVLLGRTAPTPAGPQLPSLQQLAALLYYSAGITKRGVAGGGGQLALAGSVRMYFRAAACTGALYHIELYLVCGDLPDLPAGVYHFGPHDFSLRRLRPSAEGLRQGDFRGVLAEASGGEPSVTQAPALIVTTSVFWRNAWKYQARAYRHCYWDSGTILANLLAVGDACQVPLNVVTAFADAPVNQLLGLDPDREVALHLVPVGQTPNQPALLPPKDRMPPLSLETTPYSRREVGYPAMRAVHQASSLMEPAEARDLRGGPPAPVVPSPGGTVIPLAHVLEGELPRDTIEAVIQRRGSSRRFRRAGIGNQQLAAILAAAGRHLPADFLKEPQDTLVQMYLIAQAVDGLTPGSYAYHPTERSLELLQASPSAEGRERAGYLGLEQELPADASANLYFLTDLTAVLARYGNRGYRMAQTEAAIRGGWAYLAAYAQRLGATGLTFYDDEVTQFFSPHAAGQSVMFLVALGRPLQRPRLGGTAVP